VDCPRWDSPQPSVGSKRAFPWPHRDEVARAWRRSLFRAMSCRCHRSNVSGVTIVATSRRATAAGMDPRADGGAGNQGGSRIVRGLAHRPSTAPIHAGDETEDLSAPSRRAGALGRRVEVCSSVARRTELGSGPAQVGAAGQVTAAIGWARPPGPPVEVVTTLDRDAGSSAISWSGATSPLIEIAQIVQTSRQRNHDVVGKMNSSPLRVGINSAEYRLAD
jgi:hypothetical protein